MEKFKQKVILLWVLTSHSYILKSSANLVTVWFYTTQAVFFCLQFCFVVISTGDTEDNLEIEYILFFSKNNSIFK